MPRIRSDLDHATKRAAILDRAAELFATAGYDATSMKAVAAAADVAPNTVYWYFDDKDALLVAVVDAAFARALAEAAAQAPDSPVDRLLWVAAVLDDQRQLMSAVHARAPHAAAVATWHDQFHRVIDALLLSEVGARRDALGHAPLSPEAERALPRIWSFTLEGLVAHEVAPDERRAICELLVRQLGGA